MNDSDRLDYRGLALKGVRNDMEILTAAKTLSADDSGKTLFLSLAGGFTVTLPAVKEGLNFRFIIKTSPTTAYIITGAAGTLVGGINELEVDTADDGPYTASAASLNFTANVAVLGDYADFHSDGVKWFVRGQTNADGGVTFS